MSKKAEISNKSIDFKGKIDVSFLKTLKILAILAGCIGFVVIAVCAVYHIDDNVLQNIVLAIVAAILGGLCTLLGVAWTIKKGDANRQADLKRIEDERKMEEQKKHIPYIRLVPGCVTNHTAFVNRAENLDFETFIQTEKIHDNQIYLFKILPFVIKNISLSTMILLGVDINGRYYPFTCHELVECNGICQIQFGINRSIPIAKEVQFITLVVSDILKNRYTVICKLYTNSDGIPRHQTASNNEEYRIHSYTCTVESLSLPELQAEVFENE